MEYLIISIAGLLTGLVAGVVLTKMLLKSKGDNSAQLEANLQQEQASRLDAERKLSAATAQTEELRKQADTIKNELTQTREKLSAVSQEKTQAVTQLEEATRNITEQKKMLADSQTKLTDVFKSLSGEALKSNNEAFVTLAKQSLEKVLADAKGDIGKKQQAIDALVKPISESLAKYEKQMSELEVSRQKAYSSLQEQIRGLNDSQSLLRKETGNLVTALRKPQVRGRWGEVTLHRVAELAGMVEHCDFKEQVTAEEFRPDMIVNLPAGRQIVVDSKVALDGYLSAIEAQDTDTREAELKRHARHIREHMKSLASKAYWNKFENCPEFVVMFIPGDSFLAAALDQDHTLVENAMESGVIIATPTTLVALLRAVAFGWRQEQIAENARKISDLGKELYERVSKVSAKFVTLGTRLNSTTKAYNDVMGSMERRVLPTARKFKELGATGADDIKPIEQVKEVPRELTAPEFSQENYASEE